MKATSCLDALSISANQHFLQFGGAIFLCDFTLSRAREAPLAGFLPGGWPSPQGPGQGVPPISYNRCLGNL
jgi:hypothetical protein